MVSSFSCHHDRETAIKRGLEGFEFFGFALGSLYGFGEHKPGRTDLWQEFQNVHMPTVIKQLGNAGEALSGGRGGIGTPDDLREHLLKFEKCGVDQVTFIQQAGRNQHEHICEALEIFAAEVMPEFKAREAEREEQKMNELAPYLEAAMARKVRMKTPSDEEIPTYLALGRRVTEQACGSFIWTNWKFCGRLPSDSNSASWSWTAPSTSASWTTMARSPIGPRISCCTC